MTNCYFNKLLFSSKNNSDCDLLEKKKAADIYLAVHRKKNTPRSLKSQEFPREIVSFDPLADLKLSNSYFPQRARLWLIEMSEGRVCVCEPPCALGVGGSWRPKIIQVQKGAHLPCGDLDGTDHIWFQLAPTTGNVTEPFCGKGGMGGCGVGQTFGQRKDGGGLLGLWLSLSRVFFFLCLWRHLNTIIHKVLQNKAGRIFPLVTWSTNNQPSLLHFRAGRLF